MQFQPHYKITFEMTCPHTGKIYQRTLDEAHTHDKAIGLILDIVEGRREWKDSNPVLFSASYFFDWGEEYGCTELLQGDVVRKKKGAPYLWDEYKIKQRRKS